MRQYRLLIILCIIISTKGHNVSGYKDSSNDVLTVKKNEIPENLLEDIFNKSSMHRSLLLNNLVRKIRNFSEIFEILNRLENQECIRDATYFLNELIQHEEWALLMLDATPKFPTGLLYENMYELGNFDECISIQHINNQSRDEIKGQYCLSQVTFKVPSPYSSQGATKEFASTFRGKYNTSLIHWAICIPSTCRPADVVAILSGLFDLFADFGEYQVEIKQKDCYYEIDSGLSTGQLIYGCLTGFFLGFILIATTFHVWNINKRKRLISCTMYNIDHVRQPNSVWIEVILSFSIIRLVSKLLHTKPSELNLECLCGIKLLSMTCILAGHSLIFLLGSPIANTDFANQMAIQITNSIFVNSPLLVDSFLLVSGFLMSRLLLIELDKRKGKINPILLYLARYIRLTPAYLVVLGFNLTWLPHIGSGPLWRTTAEVENERCQKSWWANLLYVNNYVNTDNLCMFQAWYLAADFHLFIIAPILIYILWKWPKTGFSVLIGFAVLTAIIPGVITYIKNLDPTMIAFQPEIQDLTVNHYFVNAYIKTHMRANSYCIGLILGYLVNWMQKNSVKISLTILWIGWILATILGLASVGTIVIFFNPDYVFERVESAIYGPMHQMAFALAVGWVIMVCVTDNANVVNRLLSWKLFVPLSRLTYCAYLVNSVVLISYKGMVREAVSWTKFSMACVLLGHWAMTFCIAFILCICFESPIHSLERILLRKSVISGTFENTKLPDSTQPAANLKTQL